MPAGLSVILMAAQATAGPPQAYGPGPTPASATIPAPVHEAQRDCANPAVPDPKSREIIVCAVRPNGYRLDPDVLAARRLKQKGESGRPRKPPQTFADHSCVTVGPMGFRGHAPIYVFTAAPPLAASARR